MSLVIRIAVEPASLAAAVRQAATEVDRTQPISKVEAMEQIISEAVKWREHAALMMEVTVHQVPWRDGQFPIQQLILIHA